MSLITKVMKQDATHWAKGLPDEYGQSSYGNPTSIKCRWTDVQVQFIAPDGTTQMSQSMVMVDRDMKPGDLIKLGVVTLGTFEIEYAAPRTYEGVFEVRQFAKIPNLRVTEYLRKVYI